MPCVFCVMACFSLAFKASQLLGAEAQRAILQLEVNRVGKGEVLVLVRDKDILVRVSDLERAGLQGLAGQRENIQGEMHVSLSSLRPDIRYELDERDLVLRVNAEPSRLGSTVLDLGQGRPPGTTSSRDTSMFVNYAVNYTLDRKEPDRYDVFSEGGLSVKGNLLYSSLFHDIDGSVIRGLTNYTVDDPERLTRIILGDSVASTGVLGSSLFTGGIKLSREFGLDPYFLQYPTIALSGAAVTPSTAEIYVNDRLLRRERIVPGRFELKNIPVPTGSGATRLVLRDALGREQEIVSPFYFTTRILARGLHEFSYNLGSRRENLSTASLDYGPMVFLGRHRLGITDDFTAGFRMEAMSRLVSGGPTLTARSPLGEVELAAAASRQEGLSGAAFSVTHIYSRQTFSLGTSMRTMSPRYAHLSLGPERDRPRLEASVFSGFQVSFPLSVTLQYAFANLRDGGWNDRISISNGVRLTDRLTLFLTGSRSRQRGSNATNELFAGLSYYFGGNTVGTFSRQENNEAGTNAVSLHKSLPLGTGIGFRFQASETKKQEQIGSTVQYQGPYGRYEVSHEHAKQRDVTTFNVAGGLAGIGGSVYLSRPVQDSFALIRVPGVEGVRGLVSNQEVGRTDSQGNLLVPNLLPYYGNRLGIADQDIPMDRSVGSPEKIVAPPFRGGSVVTFPVQRLQRFTGSLVLVISGEETIPAYGQLEVAVEGAQHESPIGKEGEFYLENVPSEELPAVVKYHGTSCRFLLNVPASPAPEVKLGSQRCVVH